MLKQNAAKIHEYIIKEIMSYSPVIKELDFDSVVFATDEDIINSNEKEINVLITRERLYDKKYNISDFYAYASLDIEHLIPLFGIKGEYLDAYGTIYTSDGELILNNHDISPTRYHNEKDGFVNILGFATVSNNGIIRYTQIVYSFRFKKIIIRDDISIKLPPNLNIKEDLSGKRATYRHGNILSIRTNLDVYEKVGNKYKQSIKYKNDLSYPRLILTPC